MYVPLSESTYFNSLRTQMDFWSLFHVAEKYQWHETKLICLLLLAINSSTCNIYCLPLQWLQLQEEHLYYSTRSCQEQDCFIIKQRINYRLHVQAHDLHCIIKKYRYIYCQNNCFSNGIQPYFQTLHYNRDLLK